MGPPGGPPALTSMPPTRKSIRFSVNVQPGGPENHRALALGSANAANTLAGAASKVRSRTNVAWVMERVVMASSWGSAFWVVRREVHQGDQSVLPRARGGC